MSVLLFGIDPETHWTLSLQEWWALYSAKCGKKHKMAQRGLTNMAELRAGLEEMKASGRPNAGNSSPPPGG